MARRIPSLNWLRVFEAAARTGSFARAAERLAMSAPAVSQQVRALEEHLGRSLFEREASGVKLTEAGRGLLAVVGDALGRTESAAQAIAAPKGPPLVIGVSATLLVGWLAPRLPGFQAKHPDVTLELHSLIGRPETPPRHAALWISFGQPPPETEADLLFGEEIIPVAAPAIARSISSREDLASCRLIEVADHRATWAQVLGRDILPAGTQVTYVDTTLAALSLAAAQGGVALARPPASVALEASLGLHRCLPDDPIRGVEAYHLLRTTGRQLDVAGQAFRSWLLDQAKDARGKTAP